MITADLFLTYLVLALVTAGLAHLLVHERGLFGVLAAFRHIIGAQQTAVKHETPVNGIYAMSQECVGSNELAKLFCCTICASTWLSLALVLIWNAVIGRNPVLFDVFMTWFTVFAMSLIAGKGIRYV